MSKKRKEVTEDVIRQWEAQNLRLLEECRAFSAGLLTYLPKRNGISALMAKIEGMHEEIHRRLQPPPPRDTTYDALYAHRFEPKVCALCGGTASIWLTQTERSRVLSVPLCGKCGDGTFAGGGFSERNLLFAGGVIGGIRNGERGGLVPASPGWV